MTSLSAFAPNHCPILAKPASLTSWGSASHSLWPSTLAQNMSMYFIDSFSSTAVGVPLNPSTIAQGQLSTSSEHSGTTPNGYFRQRPQDLWVSDHSDPAGESRTSTPRS